MKNIPHVRRISNPLLWLLDVLTLCVVSLLRIGPWYCIQCGKKKMFLATRRRSAGTFDPEVEHGSSVESAGNYIRTSESLVMRRNRAKRYSQKYRDGVVQRLIGGTATISQIGQELDLTERDLVDWIADALAAKQDRIDELMALLRSVQVLEDHVKIEYQPISLADDDAPTIDGNYRES
jgi:hypothetical protein